MAKIITEIPSISNIGVPEAPIDGIQYGREDATWTPINDISYTDEQAQDAIGTILLDTVTIDLSYNDAIPSISADIKANSIDSSHLSNSINVSEFVNDSDYATEAYVDSKIPSNYSKVVYVDSNNPNTATIFDVNNPPTVNDDTLKTDVNNLYVGLNASTWVYNSTSLTYITEPITSGTSNFYLGGTLIDALGNKITTIERTGPVGVGTAIASNHAVTKAQHDTKANTLTDVNFGAFQSVLPTVTTVADTDKIPFLIGSLSRMMTWANFKALFKTVNGNSLFGTGNLVISGNGSSYTFEKLTEAATWNITHNLGNKYPEIIVWNSNNEVIIPKSITGVDLNNIAIEFSTAVKGFATISGNVFTPSTPSTVDADALAFINADGTFDTTNQNAIKQLVTDLKAYGIWSKLIAFYPKAGTTASQHKWNLKDPRDLDVAYRQTYTGSIVHSATGVAYNSTNTFSDTKLNLGTLGMTFNLSMGVYVTVTPSNFADNYFMGAHSGSINFVAIQRSSNTKINGVGYSGGNQVTVPASVKGFIGMSILGINKATFHENNVLEVTTALGNGVPTVNVYEGALNLSGRYGSLAYTAGTSFIGYGLTNTEMKNLRLAILAFETALGRN